MADEVWPLEPDERVRLSSFNGSGFDLKGFTRKDATGRCFATRYFTVVYLGVVLVPILLWLGHADQLSESIGIGWVIGGFIAWLLGSIAAVAFLLTIYRERWAPLREAVIHDD
jgi:hypothetical protein